LSANSVSVNSINFVIFGLCRGYQQQDAHEFLRYMLDRLHTELLHLLPDFTLKDNPYISLGHKSRSSIVTSVFGGTLQSEVSIFLSVECVTDLALLKIMEVTLM